MTISPRAKASLAVFNHSLSDVDTICVITARIIPRHPEVCLSLAASFCILNKSHYQLGKNEKSAMPQQYQARVATHTRLSPDYHWYTLDLESPPSLDFQAGQFIMLSVPGIPAKKSYSIPSSPASPGQINLLIDVSPQGDGTLYLQSLKPGDPVTFMAPAGRFTISLDPTETKLILIATGSGISAVRSMALWLLQTQHDPRQIHLIWGMRNVTDVFFEEEFRMLEKEYPNFHFDLVLSKPPEGWPLCTGHVNDCLTKHHPDLSNTGFYMCGNPKMIEGVIAQLTQAGVKEANIHHERFG
jgi:NAD(P)H-flavin reductase